MKIRVVLAVLFCSFVNLCVMAVDTLASQPSMPRTSSAAEISSLAVYAATQHDSQPLNDCRTSPVTPKKQQKEQVVDSNPLCVRRTISAFRSRA